MSRDTRLVAFAACAAMRPLCMSLLLAPLAFSSALGQGATRTIRVQPNLATQAKDGFTVCVGTAQNCTQYGSKPTSSTGVATFTGLPAGRSLVITVEKAGHWAGGWWEHVSRASDQFRQDLAIRDLPAIRREEAFTGVGGQVSQLEQRYLDHPASVGKQRSPDGVQVHQLRSNSAVAIVRSITLEGPANASSLEDAFRNAQNR